VASINTSGRPSRREHSERRDSDVHGADVQAYCLGASILMF
jgi:hypothetical protein